MTAVIVASWLVGDLTVTIGTSVAAVTLAFMALAFSVYQGSKSGRQTGEALLFSRIEDLEGELDRVKDRERECERRCDALRRENIEMMRRLVGVENHLRSQSDDPYEGPGGYRGGKDE